MRIGVVRSSFCAGVCIFIRIDEAALLSREARDGTSAAARNGAAPNVYLESEIFKKSIKTTTTNNNGFFFKAL